jgi:hypothetical protein
MAGRGVGAVDEQRFGPRDAHVKGDGGQAAEPAGQDGDRQQPLPLVGHAAHQPGENRKYRPWKPTQ